MIRLSRHNTVPSVYLFQQYDRHKLMWKGHLGKAEPIVGALQHLLAQADGTADDKDKMALPLNPQIFYLLGKFYGIQHLSPISK